MSRSLLITFAVVLPLILFAGIYLFSRHIIWLALRPKLAGGFQMLFAASYAGFGLWKASDGLEPLSLLLMVGGALGFIGGLHEWRRGQPQSLE